jgi:ectoine hydroxylase-related dioxygenase (phytanoyl-CoA dioxygenase family)
MLDEETVDRFQRDGAVVLRGVFKDWIEPLRAGVERNLAEPGPMHRDYSKGGGRFFGDYCNWRRIPEYGRFVMESPAAGVARRLMGSSVARIFHEHLLVKEPGADVPTPWHHDEPYYCVEGPKTVSFWLPLDPVPRDVCLELVAGSHTWGKLFRPRRFNGTAYDHKSDRLSDMPDIDGNRDAYRILGWDLEPGDCIAFNFKTVHGAPGNRSAGRRRAFSSRWFGDGTVYADRGGETSPPFPQLATLTSGDALPLDEFPVIAGGGDPP